MRKSFMVMAIFLFGVFDLSACNSDTLYAYKAEGKATIELYAQERKDNFSGDSWEVICRIVKSGKQAIDTAKNKVDVDTMVIDAKNEIEEYEKMIQYNAMRLHAIIELGHFNEKFLKEKKTLGVRYENENWKPDDGSEKYLYDEISPEFRTFVIGKKEQFDEIFSNKFLTKIDFESEIIIVCMFTVKTNRNERITNIFLDETVMKIDYKIEYKKPKDSAEPIPVQGLLIIKLDKLHITEVNFKLV